MFVRDVVFFFRTARLENWFVYLCVLASSQNLTALSARLRPAKPARGSRLCETLTAANSLLQEMA